MNQCQGCQAGWERFTYRPGSKTGIGIEMHRVEGGYKTEVVCCTASRYQDKKLNK